MHFFISYAKADTYDLANQLYKTLNALPSISAWMDHDLQSGADWALQIQHQIDDCDQMIVLLSPDVNRRPTEEKGYSFVLKEIHYAQQEHKPIIPIMAQKTRMPVTIAGLEYIDFTRNPDMGMQRLIGEINSKMGTVGQLPIATTASQLPIKRVTQPSQTTRNIPFVPIMIGVSLLAVIILGGLILSNTGAEPSLTPTIDSQAIADEPTQIPTEEPTLIPSSTDIPENTLFPTDTPNVAEAAQALLAQQTAQQIMGDATLTAVQKTLEAQQTATQYAIKTATATVWTKTPTPDFTASVEALLTEWAKGTQTRQALDATATATLWTATPTHTLTPTLTPVPPELCRVLVLGQNGIRMRARATTNSPQITVIPAGISMAVLQQQRQETAPDGPVWFFVRVRIDDSESTGWVRSDTVTELTECPPIP